MKVLLAGLVATGLWTHLVRGAATTSPSAICGLKGYDRGTDSFWDSNDGTYSGCAAACSKQAAKCKSFAYGRGECHLYNRSAAGNFEADIKSPYTFYEASCAAPTGTTTTSQKTTSSSAASTTKQASTASIKTSTSNTTTSKAPLSSSTTSKKPSTTLAPTTTTKKTTTLITSTTKTSSAPTTNETCSLEEVGSCTNYTFTSFTDPCNKGCGCTYQEICGGGFTGGEVIRSIVGWTYSDCIRACDVHQPSCVGVEYHYFRGTCYLYSSITGTDPGSGQAYPGQQVAVRSSCGNACPSGQSCGRDGQTPVCF